MSPRRSTRPLRWMVLRVILLAKGDEELIDPPGRDLLASGSHTFADLAASIDRAFARWDLSHLHEFRLLDGRRIVMADADGVEDDATDGLDEQKVTLHEAGLRVGETFEYVFDFGDAWRHGCTVLRDDADPVQEYGRTPSEIVPIFGWGTIPDQYGRTTLQAEEDDE